MPVHLPFRFEYIVYPLWRKRDIPGWLRPVTTAIFSRFYPVDIDRNPPKTPVAIAKYLSDWRIIDELDRETIAREIEDCDPPLQRVEGHNLLPPEHKGGLIRVPAQWEPIEKVLIGWTVVYPPIWEMRAQMVAAITPVAEVEILAPSELWAKGIRFYLQWRGCPYLDRVRFLILPTNDIWIRDYGPIVGFDETGRRVAVDAIYDPLPAYPQDDDDHMPCRWAAHYNIPLRELRLHTEGGNLWSDGQGTLIMSAQVLFSNRDYDHNALEAYLHTIFDFEKLIITPRLTLEETGHVDLMVKLASPDTVLISRPDSWTTAKALRETRAIFERETNAMGQSYTIFELPTPPLYLNWFVYTIRRAYTNSLTVNGRVLVPVFRIAADEEALRVYEEAMPGYELIPIDCRKAINGGGAAHCMTKEVPAAR